VFGTVPILIFHFIIAARAFNQERWEIMRKVDVRALRPGQRIARPVVGRNGLVMLESGTLLTEKYIEGLKKIGVSSVYIDDQPTRNTAKSDAATLFGRGRIRVHEPIKKEHQVVVDAMRQFMNGSAIRERVSMPMLGDRYKRTFQAIMDELSSMPVVVEIMYNLYVKDSYLFNHSLNVAFLSGIIGMANNFNAKQLYELVTSALLFDAGMQFLPDELLRKQDSYTEVEWSLIEKHTTDGYELLKKQKDLPFSAAICALQHHERYDGSGYPRGITHQNIHDYAQIVAIADIYDALVSARYHRKKYAPNEAIEYLFGSGNRLFNLELVQLFTRYVSIYPIGSKVKLSSGQIGIISYVDASFVHRPVIKIVEETDGEKVAEPYEIDLKEHLGLTIVDTLT